ncbi:hypothetical protein Q9L58_009087 [Maublancomyces gigas]|uniref:Uncharacterized protein n=1 Tax=Discina gigas TaxID=1032678 RepID=A0ABR3G7V7_9PEZI
MDMFQPALFALMALPTYAIPVPNGNNTSPAFAWEPRGRGTIGLLTSCTVTFSLCIWTAVHPNVIPNPTPWRQSVYKIFWMAISVGLPEAIILCAHGQWRQARKIRNLWCRYFEIKPGDPGDIGVAGGFFVLMGGIVVGDKDNNDKCRTSLTCTGFEKYLLAGKIDMNSFRRRSVVDRGRASVVVKVLISCQAGWFVVQCIARVVDHLPSTLLEIHVVIQAFCALAAYAFWFDKPLDVNDTIRLPIELGGLLPETLYYSDDMDIVTEDWRDSTVNLGLKAFYDIGEYIGQDLQATFATAALTGLNGACHAAAWNSLFPNAIEGWMWRIASLGICVAPFIIAILFRLGGFRPRIRRVIWETRFVDTKKSTFEQTVGVAAAAWTQVLAVGWGEKRVRQEGEVREKQEKTFGTVMMASLRFLMCFICWNFYGFYILCITFITLESFISVRTLAWGAYETPVWNGFVPHI